MSEFGINLRVGGYIHLNKAEARVLSQGNGTVINERRITVRIIKNGQIWQPFEYALRLAEADIRGMVYSQQNAKRKNWKYEGNNVPCPVSLV